MSTLTTQLRNRWFALKGAKRPVPAGFMKLDYIESTGSQWISFAGVQVGDVLELACNANGYIVNCLTSYNTGRAFSIQSKNLNAPTAIGGIVIDSYKVVGDMMEIRATITTAGSYPRLFSYYPATTEGAKGKMAYFRHTRSGSVVGDMVPMLALPGTQYVRRNGNVVIAEDYTPGMYDYAIGAFCTNYATSGADFLYSPLPPSA